MKDSARYIKIVEWSEADNCYIGTAPGLLHGGCHGQDEQAVFKELCEIIEETLEDIRSSGQPLPDPTIGRRVIRRQDVA